MVDVSSAREAYHEWIIDDIISSRRTYNLVDANTKASMVPQLDEMMETGKTSHKLEQSLNRTVTRKDTLEKIDNIKIYHFRKMEKYGVWEPINIPRQEILSKTKINIYS